MAVQLKADGYSLLPLLGVSPNLVSIAKDVGITVDQPFPGSFYVKLEGKTYGSISVKGQAITLAKTGSLGPASKEALKSQFTTALKAAVSSLGIDPAQDEIGKAEMPTKSAVQPGMKALLAKKMAPKPVASLDSYPEVKMVCAEDAEDNDTDATSKSYQKTTLNWDGTPEQEMTSGTLAPLLKAFKLYQPVYGTSGGSVYITVALLEGAQMAGRIKTGKLSLRVEGPGIEKYLAAFADLGFGYKSKDGYASVHYDTPDDGLALKTFGAVLGRLGINHVKSCADILVIKGYGK